VAAFFVFAIFFALGVPSIAVTVRRLHDLDASGLLLLLFPLLPVLLPVLPGILIIGPPPGASSAKPVSLLYGLATVGLFVYLCKRGTVGPNRFGEDPVLTAEHIPVGV
jgi:uncharacterized membrane protein YhaH (DUF805 family)